MANTRARPKRPLPILEGILPIDPSRIGPDVIAGATLAALAISSILSAWRCRSDSMAAHSSGSTSEIGAHAADDTAGCVTEDLLGAGAGSGDARIVPRLGGPAAAGSDLGVPRRDRESNNRGVARPRTPQPTGMPASPRRSVAIGGSNPL